MAAWHLALYLQALPFDFGKTAEQFGIKWTLVATAGWLVFREYRRWMEKVSAIVADIRENQKADTETHAMLKDLSASVGQLRLDMARVLEHIRQ